MISCSLQSAKTREISKLNKETLIEFEEINHVNVKLIDSDGRILKSQDEINAIYKAINKENPSPRKNPIPSYSERETYILIQPKIEKNDFMVTEVRGDGKNLEIKIQQYDNSEFKDKKYPASVIMISKKNNYNNATIKK